MIALSMLMLGTFVGFCCLYVLFNVTDWKSPVPIITGILSAALGGGLFSIFKIPTAQIGSAIYYYPMGLCYGGLCAGIMWVGTGPSERNTIKFIHIGAFTFASILLLMVLVCPWFFDLLPKK